MRNCLYCGKPAGFFRRQHSDCSDRHQRAIATIPGFFSKVLESPLPEKRFIELLQSAAQASYVRLDELKPLCVSGLNSIIDSVLQERPLTPAQVQRILTIVESFEATFSESLGLEERLIKLSIVSELYDGKIPEPVSVVGPMPIEFGRGESVLWIFNKVTSYRMANPNKADDPATESTHPTITPYLSPKFLADNHIPTDQLTEEAKGDLIFTNRNLFFVIDEDTHLRIPISRITSLLGYAEGIQVICKPFELRSRTFSLNDSWLAGNVISQLIRLTHK